MGRISLDAHRLAYRLGLGALNEHHPCLSYSCGCVCERCLDRHGRFGLLRNADLAMADSEEHFSRNAYRSVEDVAA